MANASRVLMYVVPVTLASVLLNIPKFFEAKVRNNKNNIY
jgi:hypothetical protein